MVRCACRTASGPVHAGLNEAMLVFCLMLGRLRHVRVRRLAACLMSLAMLQLGIVRSGVCETHGGVPVAAPVDTGHTHHGGEDLRSPEPSDCDAPVGTDCCSALTSCASVLGLPPAGNAPAPGDLHFTALAPPTIRLVSIVTAPEPPPPKA